MPVFGVVVEEVVHGDNLMVEEVVHGDNLMVEEVVHGDNLIGEEVVHGDNLMVEEVVYDDNQAGQDWSGRLGAQQETRRSLLSGLTFLQSGVATHPSFL